MFFEEALEKIPGHIIDIFQKIKKQKGEIYLVGGSVRDLLMNKIPKDWDFTTNLKPEEILSIFKDAKYKNIFGTVMVPSREDNKSREDRIFLEKLKIISSDLKILDFVKKKAIIKIRNFLDTIKSPLHGINHAQSVLRYAFIIAKDIEGINLDLLELAALTHDLGAKKSNDYKHIEYSQKIVADILGPLFDKKIIKIIQDIIDHDFLKKSNSLENQIIKEADMLDAISQHRIDTSVRKNIKSHLDWVFNAFNNDSFIENFRHYRAKKILAENIKFFNQRSLDIKIKEYFYKKPTILEITTFRSEQGYSNNRHPDQIKFETKLDKDLERRDFTINALALDIQDKKLEIIDLFGGKKDIQNKIIRAVGEPFDRFKEDALRMMRVVRFACQLDFKIEDKTQRAIKKLAGSIKFISNERIRDEFIKIISSKQAYQGIMLLKDLNLLNYILPELLSGVGISQNHHHTYDVFTHSVLSLKNCLSLEYQVRLAALLHDIGKVKTRRVINNQVTFYNHEYLGAKLAKKILERLKFNRYDVDKIVSLVQNHMFYYNVGEVTEASVRRLIKKVGVDNLSDLIQVRIADRLGSGVKKAKPYKLRHLEYLMKKVQNDPVSVKMLKINGNDLINKFNIKPGPKIGAILDCLLALVIDNPLNNNEAFLEKNVKIFKELNLDELQKQAKDKISLKKENDIDKMKKDFYVN